MSNVVIRLIITYYTHTRSSVFCKFHQDLHFQLFSHAQWVIQDELLLSIFLKIKKYAFLSSTILDRHRSTNSSHILNTCQILSIQWNLPKYAFLAISTHPMSYSGWVITTHIFENQKICIQNFWMTCRTLSYDL